MSEWTRVAVKPWSASACLSSVFARKACRSARAVASDVSEPTRLWTAPSVSESAARMAVMPAEP
ncbi:hypothetical protein JRI60_14225 [Archangium violaceum]|uniref:hypothetical protein n=1 Tax=Archangium violaceum TaxID=83451 RepID=UPI001950351F|nr:hypothetical protein [Archangium violaceum]QRO00084.1 hypothetical protein JRI60_14225 [Archangium violaceum]